MNAAAMELGQAVGVSAACRVLGVPRSSLYRAQQSVKSVPRPTPPRALSPEEKAEVRSVLNSERFWDCAPREVYATLLDEGTYYCDWRTMYRILKEHDEVQERRHQRRHPVCSKPELRATGHIISRCRVYARDRSRQVSAFRAYSRRARRRAPGRGPTPFGAARQASRAGTGFLATGAGFGSRSVG